MAVGSTTFFALAVLAMAGVLISGNRRVSAQSCEGDVEGLVSQCRQYVERGGLKEAPSAACCNVLKKANVPCVCKYVTPAVELLVDVKKVIYVAETCGVAIPHGTKCGSITIPVA